MLPSRPRPSHPSRRTHAPRLPLPTSARFAVPALLLAACALPTRTASVPMRDDVALSADLYLPDSDAPVPTVLVRTPYLKRAFLGLDIQALKADGIAVVVQNTRGRYGSEGEDTVFTTAAPDGVDTVRWIGEQPWSDGKVVTYGPSAMGITQYALAGVETPEHVGLVARIATPSLYQHGMFPGGVYRQSLLEGWLEGQGSLAFLDTVAAHPWADDPLWTPAPASTVPGVHVGGFYDVFAQGTLDAFQAGGDGQILVMGPWDHTSVGRRQVGQRRFPENAADPPVGLDLVEQTFLYERLGRTPPSGLTISALPRVQYYLIGADEDGAAGNLWRTADTFPPPSTPLRLALGSDGRLGGESRGSLRYLYNPTDPVKTRCGRNLLTAHGVCDIAARTGRSDVLSWNGPVLDEPLEIIGRVRAELDVVLDRSDTDLVVHLSDLHPDGRALLLAEGATRVAARHGNTGLDLVEPGEQVSVEVDLWTTAALIDRGHRLQLTVTSSDVPRYAASRNNGLPWPESLEGPALPVWVEVQASSALVLPVVDAH